MKIMGTMIKYEYIYKKMLIKIFNNARIWVHYGYKKR